YRALGIEDATPRSLGGAAALAVASLTASGACALAVGWGIQAVGLWPIAFKVLANTIFATNSIVCLGLCGYLRRAIYPRVAALGLRYQDILDLGPPGGRRRPLAAAMALAVGAGLLIGDLHEWGYPLAQGFSLDAVAGGALLLLVVASAL